MLRVDQALIGAFVNGNFGLPVAHENLDYTPEHGTPYAEIKVLNNDETPYSIADTNETDGVFRIILRYPNNTGAVAAKSKADEIKTVFKIGSIVSYENQDVTITGFSRGEGVPETGWYKIVVSITYRAFLRR